MHTHVEHAFAQMRACLRDAWLGGLVAGFSGNASIRLASGPILVTAAGSAKGRLTPEDTCLLTVSGNVLAGSRPSSETKMHLAIYRARPDARAILHTHPPKMLALALRLEENGTFPQDFLNLPLPEAQAALKGLGFARAAAPGSRELANYAAGAARPADRQAIWLCRHGLCCLARDLWAALALAEEFEHLADIQLLSQKALS